MDPLHIFIHIPKCGGNTIKSILETRFDRNELLWLWKPKGDNWHLPPNLKVIGGHFEFGVHSHLDRPCRYFTLLRHPVERIISDYFYCLTKPNDPRNKRAVRLGLLNWPDEVGGGRMVEALCSPDGEGGDGLAKGLEQAKRNIREHFVHVGILEDIEISIDWLSANLGCQRTERRMNQNHMRPQVGKEVWNELASKIREDMALYEWVKSYIGIYSGFHQP